MKKIIFLFILLSIIGFAAGYTSYKLQLPVEKQNKDIIVEVAAGSTLNSVLDTLEENELIHNAKFASIYARLNSLTNVQANSYVLNDSLDLKSILTIINNGDFDHLVQDTMTIVEGSDYEDICQIISEKISLPVEEVINYGKNPEYIKRMIEKYPMLEEVVLNPNIRYPLEGYFYPETYNLTNVSKDCESYFGLMLDMMQAKLEPYKDVNVHELLTLASIVEAESLYVKDKAIIAGVFDNRIKANMPLGSDVTILYALNSDASVVTYEDLEVDSLYNTYRNTGLPIGPIGTVTISTIDACMNKQAHDYYYFFALENGEVIYTKTYDEHLKVVKENQWY